MATMMTKEEISKLADVLYEKFSAMNTLQLHELSQAFAKTTGFDAAPVVCGDPLQPHDTLKEQTEFKVLLKSFGQDKIKVIKAVRAATGLPLKEAKSLVDSAPVAVKEALSKDDAEALKASLTEIGAEVEIE